MQIKLIRVSTHLRVVALVLTCSLYSSGQAQSDKAPVLNAQMRQGLVENIIRELQVKYVAPDKTKAIESYMRTKLKSGAYDQIESARAFANALTTDLRTASGDLHLFVAYDPILERALIAEP